MAKEKPYKLGNIIINQSWSKG